ncbi:phage tail tape measure protein [Clostridium tetani]|nr:phage tail tape measure protein [Clostridium tetani]
MWVSLSLEGSEDLTQKEKETLIQDAFEEQFNKPEYNNWHKFDRHRGNLKKQFRKDDEVAVDGDGMDTVADNSQEEKLNSQYEYEDLCQKLRDVLKPEFAEVIIAVCLEDKTPEEYAAETSSSVDLLTTILNGYKLKAEEIANVSDILINTQNLGKTSVNELSSSMGKVVPIASAANVNLKQLSSAYVLLTQKGIATAEAGTYTRSMLSELSKTGSTADKTLRQISGKSFAELMVSGKSVGDVLNMLNEHANKNNLTLKDMFGSVEAGTASMILAGAGGQDFNKVLDTMSNVAGATDTAFNKVN